MLNSSLYKALSVDSMELTALLILIPPSFLFLMG